MSEHEYQPKSKVGKWFNDRLPLLSLASHLTDYPTPKNLNYWWTFGGILTFCLVTQIITGIVLAMHYVAHADLAFSSVEHIMRDVLYATECKISMSHIVHCQNNSGDYLSD